MHEAIQEQRYLYPRDSVPRVKDEKIPIMNQSSFRACLCMALFCDSDPIFSPTNSNQPSSAGGVCKLLYGLYNKLGQEGQRLGFLVKISYYPLGGGIFWRSNVYNSIWWRVCTWHLLDGRRLISNGPDEKRSTPWKHDQLGTRRCLVEQ